MAEQSAAIDWDKVEEMTLALLYLSAFEERGVVRTWKGHAWEALNRLHEHGWISDPVSKAKSVVLSNDGARRSRELFRKHFQRAG